jgi:hypothetical protein
MIGFSIFLNKKMTKTRPLMATDICAAAFLSPKLRPVIKVDNIVILVKLYHIYFRPEFGC